MSTAQVRTKSRSEAGQQATARRRGQLTLDLVRDETSFLALQPYWDVLVEQMAVRSPFMRWDWMSLWWEECRQDAKLALALLRDAEGVPHAIAPLMLAHESDPARRHLTTLTFLAGFGDAHGERLDFIVPAGQEDELAPQLCRVFKLLRHECDNVRLNHLPEESPNTPHILAALKKTFRGAGVLNRHISRFVSLPATWEDYEMRHNSKWRQGLRRRRRAFTCQHAGTATNAGERVAMPDAMNELRVLHAMQWPYGISSFTTEASWRFHQRLAALWLPQQRTLMPMLEVEGRVVAVIYGFVERDEFFHFQTGWESSMANVSPGRLVIRWGIDCCIRRGLRVYDLLPSDYEYKRQWADAARWLLDLEAFNPASLRATVFDTLRTLRRWFPCRKEGNFSGGCGNEHETAPRPPAK